MTFSAGELLIYLGLFGLFNYVIGYYIGAQDMKSKMLILIDKIKRSYAIMSTADVPPPPKPRNVTPIRKGK